MPGKRAISDEQLEIARQLRDAGESYRAIGRRLGGIRGEVIQYWLDDVFRARKWHWNRTAPCRRVHPGDLPPCPPERLPPLPRDDRDLTGIICGDPVSVRSALYLRQHH